MLSPDGNRARAVQALRRARGVRPALTGGGSGLTPIREPSLRTTVEPVDHTTVGSPARADGGGKALRPRARRNRRNRRLRPKLRDFVPRLPTDSRCRKRLSRRIDFPLRSAPTRAAWDRCRATCYIGGMNQHHEPPHCVTDGSENTHEVSAGLALRAIRPLHGQKESHAPTPALPRTS